MTTRFLQKLTFGLHLPETIIKVKAHLLLYKLKAKNYKKFENLLW